MRMGLCYPWLHDLTCLSDTGRGTATAVVCSGQRDDGSVCIHLLDSQAVSAGMRRLANEMVDASSDREGRSSVVVGRLAGMAGGPSPD